MVTLFLMRMMMKSKSSFLEHINLLISLASALTLPKISINEFIPFTFLFLVGLKGLIDFCFTWDTGKIAPFV